MLGKVIDHEYSLAELLRRPGVGYGDLMSLANGRFVSPELAQVPTSDAQDATEDVFVASVVEQVEIAAKYSGYITRQNDEVLRAAHYEHLRLPEELDYMQVSALSIEARQRLSKQRPETLGQASRMSGITPATISLLLVHLKKSNFRGFAQQSALSGAEVSI